MGKYSDAKSQNHDIKVLKLKSDCGRTAQGKGECLQSVQKFKGQNCPSVADYIPIYHYLGKQAYNPINGNILAVNYIDGCCHRINYHWLTRHYYTYISGWIWDGGGEAWFAIPSCSLTPSWPPGIHLIYLEGGSSSQKQVEVLPA